MKRLVTICTVVLLASFLLGASTVQAQSSQLTPGTQIRLTLADGLSSSVAHNGDPFTAIVAEPVFSGTQLILPAGAKIHGVISDVTRPKYFSMFRGGASMNLALNSIEVESRIFPARMSILSLYSGTADNTKRRKDLKTVEGEIIKENYNLKNDALAMAIGTTGGSTLGLIFGNVMRGTWIGVIGSGVYVVAKKGKDIELPAQSGMLVRMDSTVALPESLLHNASYTSGGN
ncbi:MAG TPA: hypothetical protein VEJ45_02045 [Candidatus Acidoferrales bacterium]|nr:hypothetical protein [Candidatus Acidoferrales bacterium]